MIKQEDEDQQRGGERILSPNLQGANEALLRVGFGREGAVPADEPGVPEQERGLRGHEWRPRRRR